MAFKIAVSDTFRTKVVVNVPNDIGGFDKNDFIAEFLRPKEKDELDRLRNLNNLELCHEVLVGWEMRAKGSNEEVLFSREARDVVLSIQPTPLAIAQHFWNALNGQPTKNL